MSDNDQLSLLGPDPEPDRSVIPDEPGPPVLESSVGAESSSLPLGSSAEETTFEPEIMDPASAVLYFLTNRLNLIGALSSRIVAPLAAHRKHYADLLDLWPGWVPLLERPPSPELIDIVTSERGSGPPVLVEFPRQAVGGTLPFDSGVVVTLAVPIVKAVAIHFRDDKSLREHRARSFSNVHGHDDLLRVTPDLFGQPGLPVPTIAPPTPLTVDWNRIDRVRGALSAAVVASQSGEDLATASAFLGASSAPPELAPPEWLNCASGGIDGTTGDAWRESPDGLVFHAAMEVFDESDAAVAWSQLEVLDAIEANLANVAPDAVRSEPTASGLTLIREIVEVKRDFEPFGQPTDPTAAIKALLLVLLRPSLSDLLAWNDAETGVDGVSRLAACILAGRLRGVSRESAELRSKALDDTTAEWAVGVSLHQDERREFEFVPASDRTELRSGDHTLWTAKPLRPTQVVAYLALDDESRQRARLAVSEALGWPIHRTVRISGVVSLEQTDDRVVAVSAGDVEVAMTVDEPEFVDRLTESEGAQRESALQKIRDSANEVGTS